MLQLDDNTDDPSKRLILLRCARNILTAKMASWRRCSSLRPRVCLTSRSGRSRWSASMMDAVASRMVSVAPTQLVAAAVGQQIGRLLPKQKLSSQHADGDTVGVRTARRGSMQLDVTCLGMSSACRGLALRRLR